MNIANVTGAKSDVSLVVHPSAVIVPSPSSLSSHTTPHAPDPYSLPISHPVSLLYNSPLSQLLSSSFYVFALIAKSLCDNPAILIHLYPTPSPLQVPLSYLILPILLSHPISLIPSLLGSISLLTWNPWLKSRPPPQGLCTPQRVFLSASVFLSPWLARCDAHTPWRERVFSVCDPPVKMLSPHRFPNHIKSSGIYQTPHFPRKDQNQCVRFCNQGTNHLQS